MNNEILVSFEHVTFRRDGRIILRDVNWVIHGQERWVLLGLNGSGKTTLLNMLPAYTYPSSGRVTVFGHTFGQYRWEKIRRRLGFVSSSLNHYSQTLGWQKPESIVLSGRHATLAVFDDVTDKERSRAQALMQDFQIQNIADTSFARLSQGEQRRTLLARAFMGQPDLLVLDEPCSSLDVGAREHLLRLLEKKAIEDQTPFIYVTHDITEIIPSVTHAAILNDGQIVTAGKRRTF